MSRGLQLSLLLVATSVVLVMAAAAPAHSPVAQVAKVRHCGVGTEHGYGYTYLTSLTVRRTTCKTGRKVVHHHGHLRGWHCHKHVTARGSAQYDANVFCKSGRRRVNWSFAQDT